LSSSFWRGCGAIVVLSIAGFMTLTSGSYKNGVTAPTVQPVAAAASTAVLAALAFVALWKWEHRSRGQRR
jgi:hypothetical protein